MKVMTRTRMTIADDINELEEKVMKKGRQGIVRGPAGNVQVNILNKARFSIVAVQELFLETY